MKILMIGDVVGRPGRRALTQNVRELVQSEEIDLVIANGENAAGGNGITKEVAREMFAAGVDVITTGNHIWDKRELIKYIDQEPHLIRPANYPAGTPGMGYGCYDTKTGHKIGVFNLSGRIFMPELDCPFRCADQILEVLHQQSKIILLDFHAEATSEKMALGCYLDGRISALCGTHTHVQTADERILPGGTAYITDLGMTGPYDSIIGVKKEPVIEKFVTKMPHRFEVAAGLYQFNAVLIEINHETGLSEGIKRIQNYE